MPWDFLLQTLTPFGILLIVMVWGWRQVMIGGLVPRSQAEALEETLRAIIDQQQRTIDIQARTNERLVESAKLSADLLASLRKGGE